MAIFAITRATDQIGGRVAAEIAKRGFHQRLIARDPLQAPSLPLAEIGQVSSFSDSPAMLRALTGIDVMFLVSERDLFGVNLIAAREQTGTW